MPRQNAYMLLLINSKQSGCIYITLSIPLHGTEYEFIANSLFGTFTFVSFRIIHTELIKALISFATIISSVTDT